MRGKARNVILHTCFDK